MYQKKAGGTYYVNVRWRGYPRLQLSTGTSNKTRAKSVITTLWRLREAGRRDILMLLHEHKLTLADVHEMYIRDPASLDQRIAKATTHVLGPLVTEWLDVLKSPGMLSPRTRRPYAASTIERYEQSWNSIFSVLARGRLSTAADITRGFLVDYAVRRKKQGKQGATLNRDMVAIQAFWRWAKEDRGITIACPKILKEREPSGRERWLNAQECQALEKATPAQWWPLFATLLLTGMRVGEAQGLRWSDVQFGARRIHVHDRERRLKNSAANRLLPISGVLADVLAVHAGRVASAPDDLVFPGEFGDRHAAHRAFKRACKLAKIKGATVHDCRHSFAVQAVQGGIPISRLQKLLGHSTPMMTLRYAAHAPGAYLDEDGEVIAKGYSAAAVQEEELRAKLARTAIKKVL